MKKILFFLFAVCLSAPSFAGSCNGISGDILSQEQESSSQYKQVIVTEGYVQCGGEDEFYRQCDEDAVILGVDEKLHICKTGKWEALNDNNIEQCTNSQVKFYTTFTSGKNATYIYHVQYKSGQDNLANYCKEPKTNQTNKKDICLMRGREFIAPSICESIHTKEITIYVRDKDTNQHIPGVSFTYPDLTLDKNKETNVLHDDFGNHEYNDRYEISINTRNPDFKVLIKKDSYRSVQTTWGKLKQNAIIKLCKDNSTECTANIQKSTQNGNTITGKVIDAQTKAPLSDVKISATKNDGTSDGVSTYSNYKGEFELSDITAQYVKFELENYNAKTVSIKTDLNIIKLTRSTPNNGPTLTMVPNEQPSESQEILWANNDALKQACEYTGGVYYDSICTCSADNHLEPNENYVDTENNLRYKICECMPGYHRDGETKEINGTTLYIAHGKCVPANDYEEGKELDKTAMRLDAENAYRKDYGRSQSIANKALTAVSTGMTGEGAMKAAQALAEQKADERAEREMAEYITTMQCEYGNGQQVALGKEETLPAGDLSKYYTEYKQLADKLKETKTALNLRPGIETEVLYDRAETGLYQYQTAERQSGGFTSVARALMDPTGADAAAWTTQKALVAENLKKGTLETIGGAALGLAGNYVINGERDPEYKKLKEKFRTIKIELHNKYPEIFTLDTEEESRDEITTISLPPIQTNDTSVSVPTSINMEKYTVSAEAFQSGRISLSTDGTTALTTFATEISTLLRDNPSTTIKITATGYTDPQRIKQEPATINWLTNTEYNRNNFGHNPTPQEKYPTGKIKENKDLATARAERVTTFLDEHIVDTNLKQRIQYDFDGKDEKECKETQKENYVNCRKVVVTIMDTTSSTSQ